jgi:hypothetical protein
MVLSRFTPGVYYLRLIKGPVTRARGYTLRETCYTVFSWVVRINCVRRGDAGGFALLRGREKGSSPGATRVGPPRSGAPFLRLSGASRPPLERLLQGRPLSGAKRAALRPKRAHTRHPTVFTLGWSGGRIVENIPTTQVKLVFYRKLPGAGGFFYTGILV